MANVKVIESGSLKGFPFEQWRFLSGDANRLESGGIYINMSGDSVSYRNLRNWVEECGCDAKATYWITEGYLNIVDLTNDEWIADAMKYCDYPVEEYPVDKMVGMLTRIQAAIMYGDGADKVITGNNARKLLMFNPWCPGI